MGLFASLLGGALEGYGQGQQIANKREEDAQNRLMQLREAALLKGYGAGGPGGSRSRGGGGDNAQDVNQLMVLGQMSDQDYNTARIGASRAMGDERTAGALRSLAEGPTTTIEEPFDRTAEDPLSTVNGTKYKYELPKYGPGQIEQIEQAAARNWRAAFYGEGTKKLEEGRSQQVATDALIKAGNTGEETDLRKAQATQMAADGKDRFGVSGNTAYDKAGLDKPEMTEYGQKIAEARQEANAAKERIANIRSQGSNITESQRKQVTARLNDIGREVQQRQKALDDLRSTGAYKWAQPGSAEQQRLDAMQAVIDGLGEERAALRDQLGAVVTGQAPEAPKPQVKDSGTPKISTKAEYDRLPSGSRYIAPDGSRRIKP